MSLSGKSSMLFTKDTRRSLQNVLSSVDKIVEDSNFVRRSDIADIVARKFPNIKNSAGGSVIVSSMIVPNEQLLDMTVVQGYTWIVPDGFKVNSVITLDGDMRCL